MKHLIAGIAAAALLCGQACATVLVEDFEAAFPAWESAWFGANSNAQNFYGAGAGRGASNPDGLWLSDGDGIGSDDLVSIRFTPAFGATLTSFSIDIATYVEGMRLVVYDAAGQSVFDEPVSPTAGATRDPGIYEGFSIAGVQGISGFDLVPGNGPIEGNTSIDNLRVTQVPEPSSFALLGLGLFGMGLLRRGARRG